MELEGENENNGTNPEMAADPPYQEISLTTGNGGEIIPADTVELDYYKEISESEKNYEGPADGEAAPSEPEENCKNEPNQDLDEMINTANEKPLTHEEGGVSDDDGGPHRQHLETTSSQEEEDQVEEEELTPAAPAEKEDFSFEEYTKLLEELSEQRDKAVQQRKQLQLKLVDYFSRKANEEAQVERERPESEQQQEYERYMKILTELKQQINTESETAQRQQEELRSQTQETLDKVETEWQAFMALKQDVAVSVLSRRLGKQSAQAKVESTLAAEQLHQDKLIKLRLKHLHLRSRIHRLEAELHDGDQQKDPLQIQFERLQAERLEQRRQTEKQNEESEKIQKKINSSLEVLTNIKEKLSWSQMEVQTKKEQLAEVEATLARKRYLLTRIKKSHNNLQRDNQRLRERRGLLGDMVLLRDFEDTVDATDLLEKKLDELKGRQAEIAFSSRRGRKKL